MDKVSPLFSIVTVTYNAEKLIEDTMKSIFNQTYKDYEYIVVDGKSIDDTMAVVEKYRKKIDVLVSEPDKGIYDAMNKAIRLASGQYINFMNCGDYFANENVLEKVSVNLNTDRPDVIYGNTIINTVVGKYLVKPGNIDKTITRHIPFCHQSTFVRLDIAKQYMFDLSYKATADYNMFMQLYKERKTFMFIDYPVAIYQNDSEAADHQSYKRVLEAAKVNKKLSVFFKAYVRFCGGYLRSILPDVLYKAYRRCKYAFNSRYTFIGY